jgi:Flp pilus assembly protein TadD
VAEAQLAEMAVEASDASALERLLADRRRGDYPEIEAEPFGFTITEQVRIASDSYEKYDQALILLRQERFEEAIAALVELTELAPQITAPYVDLGIAYGRVGDLERAASVLETAAQLSPDHPLVHNELGIIYRRSGRFAEARAEYEKALSVFPDFHFARRNLAVLCDLYLADIQCALQNYQLYLASVDEDPEVEIWIADLSARAGENLQGALR